jgi:hypothetical protein
MDKIFIQFYGDPVGKAQDLGDKALVNDAHKIMGDYIIKRRKRIMNDMMFAQFYGKPWGMARAKWFVYNGFSQTYDLCKNYGDFYWVEHDYGMIFGSNKFDEEHIHESVELPITKGKVFVSASLSVQVYQTYLWALKYPNVEFIVGGPAFDGLEIIDEIPKNMVTFPTSIEDYFGEKDFSYKWKFEPPKKVLGDHIAFTYTLDNWCHHQKCAFCNWCPRGKRQRPSSEFHWEFSEFGNEQQCSIHLPTPAIKPSQIRKLATLPLDMNATFHFYMRAARPEIDAMRETLKKAKDPSKFVAQIGFEFPTKHMYEFMNKGSTPELALELFELLMEYNCRIVSLWIVGWPQITQQDVDELGGFLNKLPVYDRHFIKLNNLHLVPNMHNKVLYDIPMHDPHTFGPLYVWALPKLTDEQLDLNRQAVKHLKKAIVSAEMFEPPNREWRLRK